jgi:hypothetical protein
LFSFPSTRLLFDAGEETFPMKISTFSGRTDRHFFVFGRSQKKFDPARPIQGAADFRPSRHTFYKGIYPDMSYVRD